MGGKNAATLGVGEKWMGSIVAALIRRTEELARIQGHTLDTWTPAKRKVGRGSWRSTCVTCGRIAVVMPLGDGRVDPRDRSRIQVGVAPGIRGEALGERCVK